MNAPSEQSKVEYRRAIVTFLDVLGFREIVKKGDAARVKSVLDTVARFTGSEDDDELSPVAVRFSDSIVRVRFLDGLNAESPAGLVFHEIMDMVHAQAELVKHDVVLRGAVSVGEIYQEQEIVFGPALVRAYELETKFALYPRIVVDPFLLNATLHDPSLGSAHHDPATDRQYIRNLLRRGENGFWFVDYLFAVTTEFDEPELEGLFLEHHKKLVTSRYADAATRATAIDKILWLARYHNSRIAKLSDPWLDAYNLKRDALTITTKELPDLARLPRRKPTL